MTRTIPLALALAALAAGCSQATPEQQIVNDAATALGGRDRILAVKTLVLEGEGTNGNLGQDMTMDASGQQFQLSGYKRSIDYAIGRARTEQTRTPNFAYFQGQQPQKQVFGVDGGVGYTVAANGNATRTSSRVAADRQAEMMAHHPLGILRIALAQNSTLTNPRDANGQRVVDIQTGAGGRYTLAIDSATRLPTRVVSMTYNANLGDVAVETNFADYQEVKGLKLPALLTTKTDKYTTADIRVTRQTVDGETGDIAAPQTAAAAAPAEPPPPTVTAEEIAKGVWFLAGQSHHSVLAEFGDHLVLIEAPQSEARALAVIAKARELRPGKPITQLVVTHHHFDHSAGLRAAVSEGLAVITQSQNVAFFKDAVSRQHTIVMDALARNPKSLTIEGVDEEKTLSDSAMTIELYHIAGSPHGDTLLMAYFPKQKLLVEADAFSPASAVQPYAANLIETIKKRNLAVDRIVPIHGTIAPYSELLKTQASTTH